MQDNNTSRNKYAYAKIQKANDDSYFIRTIPTFLTTKYKKQAIASKYQVEPLAISCSRSTGLIAAIWYDPEVDKLMLLSLTENLYLNGTILPKVSQESLTQNNIIETRPSFYIKFREESKPILDLSEFYLADTEYQDIPQAFCFVLPNKNAVKYQSKKAVPATQVSTNNLQPVAKMIDKSVYNRWTSDDREQLKKLILQYGYGRWKQLQRSSSLIGGKLQTKSDAEIKAFANSFVRALGVSLPDEEGELKTFLKNLIEESPEDLYIPPNQKDWDQQIPLSQRAVQYSKRIQLLNRVRSLVRKFKEEQLRNIPDRDRSKSTHKYINPYQFILRCTVNWDGLLNFIPLTFLFGQRPAQWWAKKHDVDLILGVHKYGYANYSAIKSAREYCFLEMERSNMYGQFPSADNLTRRLKKLMQTVAKIEQSGGNLDFDMDAQSQQDEKLWTQNEKRVLFKLLIDYGIPLTLDGRSNWMDIREKLKELYIKQFDKTLGHVQKMVSRIRWNCQEMVSSQTLKSKQEQAQAQQIQQQQLQVNTTPEKQSRFTITQEQANKFNKNLNLLSFVRKSLMSNDAELFHTYIDDLRQKHLQLSPDDPAFIEEQEEEYDCGANDLSLIQWVSKNGFIGCPSIPGIISTEKAYNRIEWLCEAYRQFKQKANDKKKKMKVWEEPKKRTKFELNKDKSGNILFPITINPSLKLIGIGRICTLPNYHSEHNLFPIGFISSRTHASMFHKGQRCNYICEILEGDGKPIYKVTSEEDPGNPIVRDSSTGCWVHICHKVNQLQEIKKQKVTISGTQRFGLLQPNVVRLLEDLPFAEKCTKYKFKFKNLQNEGEE